MAQAHISRNQGQRQVAGLVQSYPSGSKHLSYPTTVASYDAPAGYPGTGTRMSMNQYASGQFTRGSTMPMAGPPEGNLARQSRSLGASKASIVREKLGKTSIHREYQDKRLRSNLQSPTFGKGRIPFSISIVLFILGGLLIISGVTVLLLRFHNNIMLSIDKGDFVGPLLVAIGIASIAGGIKFLYDAYIISNKERNKIKFTPANESLIRATTASAKGYKVPPGEILMSGTVSANAVSRTPHGSMGSLNNI